MERDVHMAQSDSLTIHQVTGLVHCLLEVDYSHLQLFLVPDLILSHNFHLCPQHFIVMTNPLHSQFKLLAKVYKLFLHNKHFSFSILR